MNVIKHLGFFHSKGHELVDVEEPSVIEFHVGPPERESVVLVLEQEMKQRRFGIDPLR